MKILPVSFVLCILAVPGIAAGDDLLILGDRGQIAIRSKDGTVVRHRIVVPYAKDKVTDAYYDGSATPTLYVTIVRGKLVYIYPFANKPRYHTFNGEKDIYIFSIIYDDQHGGFVVPAASAESITGVRSRKTLSREKDVFDPSDQLYFSCDRTHASRMTSGTLSTEALVEKYDPRIGPEESYASREWLVVGRSQNLVVYGLRGRNKDYHGTYMIYDGTVKRAGMYIISGGARVLTCDDVVLFKGDKRKRGEHVADYSGVFYFYVAGRDRLAGVRLGKEYNLLGASKGTAYLSKNSEIVKVVLDDNPSTESIAKMPFTPFRVFPIK